MAQKFIVLRGSPRKKGNTHLIAGWVIEGLEAAGVECEIVDAARLENRHGGCVSCYGCQRSDTFACTVKDETAEVVARIGSADGIVLATPIYWFGMSAQLKALVDRMFCLVKFDGEDGDFRHGMAGKPMVFVATSGGGPDSGLDLTEQTFRLAAGFLRMPFHSFTLPFCPHETDRLAARKDLKRDAVAFGRNLGGEG